MWQWAIVPTSMSHWLEKQSIAVSLQCHLDMSEAAHCGLEVAEDEDLPSAVAVVLVQVPHYRSKTMLPTSFTIKILAQHTIVSSKLNQKYKLNSQKNRLDIQSPEPFIQKFDRFITIRLLTMVGLATVRRYWSWDAGGVGSSWAWCSWSRWSCLFHRSVTGNLSNLKNENFSSLHNLRENATELSEKLNFLTTKNLRKSSQTYTLFLLTLIILCMAI